MRLLVFDDDRHHGSPLTDLRPAFDVRSGILSTRERIARTLQMRCEAVIVPQRLEALTREREGRGGAAVNEIPAGDDNEPWLLINGCWLLPEAALNLSAGEAVLARSGRLIAAATTAAKARRWLASGDPTELSATATEEREDSALLTHPWDVIASRDAAIVADFNLVRCVDAGPLPHHAAVIGDRPVEVDPAATVHPGVVLDASHGPITIHSRAVIRPGAILCGPCAVGPDSVIVDRAHIKPNTVIGPVCKVGGEVGGTIFQGYSNKAHEGHLGDSWVGEWVNFGAGTTNSNLLNTYSEVSLRPTPGGPRRRSGLTFLGCMVGDHAKFAILTRIMTGSIIGAGAMVASTAAAPTTVAPFAWITDDGERRYRFDKFIEVARAVTARRNIELSDAMVEALRAIHDQGGVD